MSTKEDKKIEKEISSINKTTKHEYREVKKEEPKIMKENVPKVEEHKKRGLNLYDLILFCITQSFCKNLRK